MATADGVKNKIQSLIDSANATTGNTDTDLTTAVDALIAGFENYNALLDSFKRTVERSGDSWGTGIITIPNGVTKIGVNAFAEHYFVDEIILPEGITTIGQKAFYYCGGMSKINLPSTITSIGAQAFFGCQELVELTFHSTPTIAANSFGTSLLTINVPWAEGEVANAPWGATNATINYNYSA